MLRLLNDFSLASPVIEAKFDDETHFVQLIARSSNGKFRIRCVY